MRHYWQLLLWPLVGGCLANFTSFDESEFLTDFQEEFCEIYADCQDGGLDGRYQNIDRAEDGRAICVEWTSVPYEQGCKIQPEQAITCYEEMLNAKNTLNECEDFWKKGSLPTCHLVYLNCVTEKPFGSLPTPPAW